MSVIYGGTGLNKYDVTESESSSTNFIIELDTTASVSLVLAQWAMSTETDNFNARLEARNVSTAMEMSYRLMTHGTTSSFSGANATDMPISYWNLGAASPTSHQGEFMRTMIWIYNLSIPYSASEPSINNVTLYGTTSWESTAGATNIASWTARVEEDDEVAEILIKPQASTIRWHRAHSWTIADT